MDALEHVEKFKEFLEEYYEKELHTVISQGKKSLVIDFINLIQHEPELADELLENPEDSIKSAELALEQFDIPDKNLRIRFTNLPQGQYLKISDIRSEHINKFLVLEGIVRQASDVRPQVTNARFECPNCSNTMTILQLDTKFKEPSRCSCGRKGHFRLLSKDLVDAQHLLIEEAPENLEGGEQPKRLNVFLKEDLVEPKMEKKTTPGSKVKVYGIIKEIPILLKTGVQSTRFDLAMDINYIESVQEDYSTIELSEEDKEKIKEFSKDPQLFEKFTKAIAPSIYGHDKIKEAIVLQMIGGIRKKKEDGTVMRGDIHILLVGDPGSGKSQILQFVSKAAPKARYVSGKGASGVGLTAAVVKDEILKGWALEAGALVLANKGIVVVDELDKMEKEDRSALHEAMEQQSYHPDFEIMFSDGSTRKIGNFVDKLIEENKNKVIAGKDCEILPIDDYEVLTTDFNKIYPIKINRVSRHKAPDYFIEASFSNGRKIKVTPEHPFFIFGKDGYKEVSAENLIKGMLIPAPRNLPTKKIERSLKTTILKNIYKKIYLPQQIDSDFASLLGYVASEGHAYYDKNNSYAEIGVTNTDPSIITEMGELFDSTFKCHINHNVIPAISKERAKKDQTTIRCCSIPLYNYFKENFYGLTLKAPKKFIPNTLRCSNNKFILNFLKTSFKGGGFADSERFGYSTASYKLAKDYSDLLLMNNIWNYIAIEDRKGIFYYKAVISGLDSMNLFFKKIVDKKDNRRNKIMLFCKRSENKMNDRDIIPLAEHINSLLKDLKISDGYFLNIINRKQNAHVKTIKKYILKIEDRIKSANVSNNLKQKRRRLNIQLKEIAARLGCSTATMYNLEKRNDKQFVSVLTELVNNKINDCKNRLEKLKFFINSDIRLVKVKSIRKINNGNIRWVYDVTVEPNHTFISEGLVLHNTITIAKANIHATLRAETTMLAAANPKSGRFESYTPIASQIDLPPTLINRFDLIFPVRDIPDRFKDEKIASHVLEATIKPDMLKTEITTDFLRKYIAYVRQNSYPKLSQDAIDEIKNFYITLRNDGKSSDASIKSVPISARQLEALLRLSEASARLRLADEVSRADSKRAIELLKHCLMQVGFDYETQRFDIDMISTGVTANTRNKMMIVKEIINALENKHGKSIPIEDVMGEAESKGISKDAVEDIIEKLKRGGDIFEPKRGFVQKI